MKIDSLKTLVAAGSVREAILIGSAQGLYLQIHVGPITEILHTQRGKIRYFKTMNTATAYIRNEVGLTRFAVDIAGEWPKS